MAPQAPGQQLSLGLPDDVVMERALKNLSSEQLRNVRISRVGLPV